MNEWMERLLPLLSLLKRRSPFLRAPLLYSRVYISAPTSHVSPVTLLGPTAPGLPLVTWACYSLFPGLSPRLD